MKVKGRILKAYPCASAKQILHTVSYPSSLVLNNPLHESALQTLQTQLDCSWLPTKTLHWQQGDKG